MLCFFFLIKENGSCSTDKQNSLHGTRRLLVADGKANTRIEEHDFFYPFVGEAGASFLDSLDGFFFEGRERIGAIDGWYEPLVMAIDNPGGEVIQVRTDIVRIQGFVKKEAPEPCLSEEVDLIEDDFFFLVIDFSDFFFIVWITADFFLQ